MTIILTKEQLLKYKRNESLNFHCENLLFVAEISGRADLILRAKTLLAERNSYGYLHHSIIGESNSLNKELKVMRNIRKK